MNVPPDPVPHPSQSSQGVPITVLPMVLPSRSPWRTVLQTLFAVLLCGLLLTLFWFWLRPDDDSSLKERHFVGDKTDLHKVALIRIEGVLYEGMTGYFHKQIARAMDDAQVKAVVLRINSPGGTITASDQLHHALMRLRDGDPLRKSPGKPLVVSMGSIAASGGYYVAVPAKTLYAERTTMTGSIGVYAALPNVKELADKVGVKMIVIKRGGVKDSGSPFHTMDREEQALWQGMIDHSYERFKAVVEEGRPHLKGKMEEPAFTKSVNLRPDRDQVPDVVELVRQRADGGTFTADEALKLGLIDKIGFLEDAIKEARQLAGLPEDGKVIQYERPPTLLGLAGIELRQEHGSYSMGLIPRLWYLSGQCDLAGLMQSMGRSE